MGRLLLEEADASSSIQSLTRRGSHPETAQAAIIGRKRCSRVSEGSILRDRLAHSSASINPRFVSVSTQDCITDSYIGSPGTRPHFSV